MATLFLCVGILLAGCSSPPGVSAPSSAEGAADAAPQDSVRIDEITYVRGAYGQSSIIAAESVDQQTSVGRVQEQVASYNLKDGQATKLKAGTPLYAVRGYDPSFRVAARETQREEANKRANKASGVWALYEVQSNPGADRDSVDDLLDIQGKVERIDLEVFMTDKGNSARQEDFVLGPEDSTSVASAALSAPLQHFTRGYFKGLITFHLEDDTRSIRVYDPYSGELFLSQNQDLDSGVVLPRQYRRLLMPTPRD